jgi:iron complex outermembrane recepter protein
MRVAKGQGLLAGCSITLLLAPMVGAYAADVDDNAALEEVVVTAQKKSEDLQKASIAVDVVSGEQLANSGVKNVVDLQDIVPAVRFVAADQMTVLIRGLGTVNDNPGVSSAVGYAQDGVYLAHPPAVTPVLVDLQRVEVLLGPQGTLYGRNTNGGVINFISRDPTIDELSGYVRVGGGTYSAVNSEAAINLPLGNDFALRLSAGNEKHAGYVDDGTNNLDSWTARGKLLYAPNADFSAKLTLEGGQRDSRGQGYGGQCPPGNLDPFCAGVPWRPYGGFSPSPNGLINNDAVYAGTLDINATLPWAKLTSITAYRGYDFYATTSPASNPETGGPNFLYSHPDHSRSFTQELRLSNTEASGLAWVAGLFYSHESEPSYVRFDYINSILQNPAFVNPPAPPNFYQQFSVPSQVDRSVAAFADATLPIVERFRLRGGLRYTNERKTALGTIDSGATGLFAAPTEYTSASETDSRVTWKAGADFDVTPENLLYLTVSTGFKSGGINNLPADIGVNTYAPEKITAYEIGSKNRFVDNRVQVNLSIFRYDYKNYQTFEFYTPTGGPFDGATFFPTLNSQTATFQGGEVSGEFALSGIDRVGLGVNYLDNKFDRFVVTLPFSPTVDLSNTAVPLSPRFAGYASYQHIFKLGSAGDLTAGVDAHFSGRYVVSGNQGNTTDSALYVQPSFAKLNADLAWHSATGGWTVSAFARNLTQRATINTVAGGYPVADNVLLINAMVDPPRTLGASIQKDF